MKQMISGPDTSFWTGRYRITTGFSSLLFLIAHWSAFFHVFQEYFLSARAGFSPFLKPGDVSTLHHSLNRSLTTK